ncbi:hypothetical protein [Streptomyces sp. NPDC056296]|uniref:hypothetical protein n=1 Tax=Streptomyces sp. NPDC056296 TaxID=3345775 RepID=UPI0035D823E8
MAFIALTATTGCSGEKKEHDYAVPESLCGTPVNADEIIPFLPAGENVEVKEETHYTTEICKVIVDDVLILTATQAWVAQGKSTPYFAAGQTLETPRRSTDSSRILFSGKEGFGKTHNCVDSKQKQELYVALQFQGSKHSDPEAIKRLVTSYKVEVENSPACTAGAQ